jgi:O-methyltransferase/methyltransferase family protein
MEMGQMTSSGRINELIWDSWKTRALHSAIELGVCTELAKQPLGPDDLSARLGLRADPRAVADYFDALVAIGLLRRAAGRYANSAEAAEFLDENKTATYAGAAILKLLALPALDLAATLRNGRPSGSPASGREFYERLYATQDGVSSVLRGMSLVSTAPADVLAGKFPWQRYHCLVDVGCAEGAAVARILRQQPHLRAVGFDLPVTAQAFADYVAAAGVADRARFQAGDFFHDPLPPGDVLLFGQILHNWDLDRKLVLIRKAYDTLPDNGAVIIYETLIDDERSRNAIALFVSLSMSLSMGGGFDFTGAECRQWLTEAGFSETAVEHLDGPRSMIVGIK